MASRGGARRQRRHRVDRESGRRRGCGGGNSSRRPGRRCRGARRGRAIDGRRRVRVGEFASGHRKGGSRARAARVGDGATGRGGRTHRDLCPPGTGTGPGSNRGASTDGEGRAGRARARRAGPDRRTRGAPSAGGACVGGNVRRWRGSAHRDDPHRTGDRARVGGLGGVVVLPGRARRRRRTNRRSAHAGRCGEGHASGECWRCWRLPPLEGCSARRWRNKHPPLRNRTSRVLSRPRYVWPFLETTSHSDTLA